MRCLAAAETRSMIRPTLAHAIRISSLTADLEVLTANHATCCSNS